MTFVKALILLSAAAFSSTALAELSLSEQYDTVEELMYAHQDYDPSNNTFEMLDSDKPHYRLSKLAFASEPESVTYYENWRAAIYGVYNVFAHTSIEKVTVTATPLEIPSFQQRDQTTLLDDESVTLEMNREQAFDVLASLIDIDSLSDVKVSAEYGYQWSEEFITVYYEDRQPGLDALISELNRYCRGKCE
ncbi:hypothetical protein QT231_23855 [Halomonas sp. SpR1]|uniref:hypothetical protein n=1 Tax=Halomonas sp. SpR1 TaxID=3050462 RepID=UPI0027E46E58|nr:hypothetical protein [Halomonas sp. SpR1]MDQ7735738.1 hypothetical protein [Halomonas sp. SpR1]